MKRPILIACATFVTAAGSLVVASPANACPPGTIQRFEGVCTSGQGGSAPPQIVVPPQGASVYTQPGAIPSINGIPCNDAHWATCYAMQQNG